MGDIIIRKKKRGAEPEEAGGGWKIALADFMCTLMITFFALWIVGTQDEESKSVLADYFKGVEITEDQKAKMLAETFEHVTELLEAQGLIVAVTQTSRGITIKFDSNTLFTSGSARLLPSAENALKLLAKETNKTGLFYHVYGYTDNTPVRKGAAIKSNLKLSVLRAIEASDAIIYGGVPSERVSIHAEGQLNPIDSGETEDSHAKNRRVELYMSYSSAPHKIYSDNVTYYTDHAQLPPVTPAPVADDVTADDAIKTVITEPTEELTKKQPPQLYGPKKQPETP